MLCVRAGNNKKSTKCTTRRGSFDAGIGSAQKGRSCGTYSGVLTCVAKWQVAGLVLFVCSPGRYTAVKALQKDVMSRLSKHRQAKR